MSFKYVPGAGAPGNGALLAVNQFPASSVAETERCWWRPLLLLVRNVREPAGQMPLILV
jgi:hypothetical protein